MDVRPSSPATPPPLVGRDRELALLQGLLTAARDGQGSVVLIDGEAGIGKTALADTLGRDAAGAGVRVLAGHCFDRTETPPYGPWTQVVRRVQSLPGAANAASVPRFDGATSQADLYAEARDFLVGLAAERPLVLVLEDLHWSDAGSLDLLRFVAHGIEDLPLLLVATYRGEEIDRRHPLASLVPLLVREAPTERLGLPPLDTVAARALVRASHVLADATVDRLAEFLIERTEGNPLFMTELLRSLEEGGLLDRLDGGSYAEILAGTPVPVLLQQIVDDRLSRLGDETAALLAIAAVVGQEVPLAVWGAVTRADEEALLAAAERAEAAHLVTASTREDAIRFSHALIRDVLYQDVPALRRRRIHQRVGEALAESRSPDPDAVAYHFQQAGDDRGAGWLTRAAERAEDAYALATAADRYAAAFALLDARWGDAAERGWLRLLAASLRRHDDPDQAFAWTEEAVLLAATAGDPSLVARAQAFLGLLLSYRGDYHTAMATATAAADMVDRLPPGSGTTRRREQQIDKIASRGTLTTFLAYGGRLAEARAQGEAFIARFADAGTTPGVLGAIADAHKGLSLAYAYLGEPVLARRSIAAAVAAYRAIAHHVFALGNLREELILAVIPYQADNLTERERVVAAAERMAEWVIERGNNPSANLPQYVRVPLLVLEGAWREARRILESPETPDFAMTAYVRPLLQGRLARAQGDSETAWRSVHELPLTRPDDEPGGLMGATLQPYFQLLAAELALDAGDLPTARNWLDLHRRWMDYMGAILGRAEGEILEAEWQRAAGDADRSREHAERALALGAAPRQPLALLAAHRMLGVLATDVGRFADADRHVAEALALAEACRAPYERAITLLARAELAVAQGDHPTAMVALDEVRAICLPIDARPALTRAERIAVRVAREGETPGARLVYPAGLTSRETEVLRLVATGLSNAEIAERLFLSPNTVKVHVARILAKIRVNNRAGATEFALRNGIA